MTHYRKFHREGPGRLIRQSQRVSEKSVEHAIRTRAELNGFRTHKIDVMRGVKVSYRQGGIRNFSEGVPGQPDLIIVRKDWACYCECKAPDGALSPEQKIVHDVMRKSGFIVIVAFSETEFVSQMKDLGWHLR